MIEFWLSFKYIKNESKKSSFSLLFLNVLDI